MKSRAVRDPRCPYPKDSQDKKAARLFLYKHAVDIPRAGAAITLAGSDPRSEIELMRYYLQWPKERVWFVDADKSKEMTRSLKSIRSMWPGVHAVQANLRDTLPQIGNIGFAHLDFMGHLNHYNVLPCIHEVVPQLIPGAIVGISWFRGREQWQHRRAAKLVWEEGKGQNSLANLRWAGVSRVIDKLTNRSLEFLGGLEYQHHHSPMCVSVYRRRGLTS